MKRSLSLALILFLLILAEILKVYFIMPFPGSQHNNTLSIAYFLHNYIWWFRVTGWLLFLLVFFNNRAGVRLWKRIVLILFIGLYGVIFYLFNFKFLADKMFYQPTHKQLADAAHNTVDSNKLVIGLVINGEAVAYPIEIIGYHHQVQDTVGGQPVMVTYCTVCRTGRVFSPFINAKFQQFRLVGMDHFNAMFEDAETKSWWRQATGEAVAGPLKGSALKEIPSHQMRLATWIGRYPATKILQPDTVFLKQYKDLKGFDEGTIKSGLEKRNAGSWEFKSWVVGVVADGHAKAFDWNELLQKRVINDSIAGKYMVLVLEKDGQSFHAFYRPGVNEFESEGASGYLVEKNTNNYWSPDGICMEGAAKDSKLIALPAYQEFWHSWQYFHPETTRRLR